MGAAQGFCDGSIIPACFILSISFLTCDQSVKGKQYGFFSTGCLSFSLIS